jgi:hypothetical protein
MCATIADIFEWKLFMMTELGRNGVTLHPPSQGHKKKTHVENVNEPSIFKIPYIRFFLQ